MHRVVLILEDVLDHDWSLYQGMVLLERASIHSAQI